MKKNLTTLLAFIGISILFSGCTTTFFGTVLIITFRDLITYVMIGLVISVVASLFSRENGRRTFWICFIMSLVLTPVTGLIYCLIVSSNKRTE